MKHKQLLALFLCLVIIESSKIISNNSNVVMVKDVSNNMENYWIENYKEDDESKQINIFYPVTNYKEVNDLINKKIDVYLNRFKNATFTSDVKKLEISFEDFEYSGYTSFKFTVKSNIGITHDIDEVFTVVHKDGTIIDIEYLKSKNNDILTFLHDNCYKELKENENIKQYSTEEWINSGLEKDSNNYNNFIITPDSFVVYFNPYTIAPYVAGIIEIKIPLEYIKESKTIDII